MNRELRFVLLAVVISLASVAPGNAASNQPFFQGSWRCQHGESMNVTPALGPWLNYRVNRGSTAKQSYVYHDEQGGGWVNTGVDSDGGYWTMTSSGWQGRQLTFTGTYTNHGKAQSQRQVFTQNSNTAVTVQIWRDGSLIGQSGCNK